MTIVERITSPSPQKNHRSGRRDPNMITVEVLDTITMLMIYSR